MKTPRRLSHRHPRPLDRGRPRPDRRREPPPASDVDFNALAKLRRRLAAPQWQRRLAELAAAEATAPDPAAGLDRLIARHQGDLPAVAQRLYEENESVRARVRRAERAAARAAGPSPVTEPEPEPPTRED